jgi:hypothetical protein
MSPMHFKWKRRRWLKCLLQMLSSSTFILICLYIYVPIFFILFLFANSAVRDDPLEVFSQQGPKVVNITSMDLNNGWIPNEDILRIRNKDITSLNKIGKTELHSRQTIYSPGLEKFPLNLLQNLTTPIHPTDLIFQWHIPKAAGTNTKAILSHCFHLARAEQRKYPESFEFFNNVMNLDTSSIAGIARAIENNLAHHDLLDVITSSYVHEGAAIFTKKNQGRLFAIMRHPVEISESMFHYLGKATWERTYNKDLKNMTLLEYATSKKDGLVRQ